MIPDFCALILTHGRPNNVRTVESLRKGGYTGPWFIVIDDEDPTADEYRARYGDKVIQFSKTEIAAQFDEGDNFNDRRCIVYARNASFDIAEQLGFRYFIQLDDDYISFRLRFDDQLHYWERETIDLDTVWSAMLDLYKSVPWMTTFAMSQGGDFIGGKHGARAQSIQMTRKAMNSFICDTQRRFWFPGRLNEDVNAYTALQHRGHVFLTTNQTYLIQAQTQTNDGGMSDIYLSQGTYVKSFYTVMHAPSAVKIKDMGSIEGRRLHHSISWNNVAPRILSETHRRTET